MINYKNLFIFSAGISIGGLMSYVITKDKYETIMNKEIEEIRKYYKDKYENIKEDDEEKIKEKGDYREIVREYVSNHVIEEEDCDCDDEEDNHYTIMESRDLTNGVDFDESKKIESWEFGEQPLYETETIILYSDGVATNDLGDVIDNLEEIMGVDQYREFKESSDESIFIRNDLLRMDYEIVKDDWRYEDLIDS